MESDRRSSTIPPPTPSWAAANAPAPTPLATDRRPRRSRVKQVGSRYLSPSHSSSSERQLLAASNGFPPPSSLSLLPQKHRQQKPHAPEETDENQPLASIRRSLETPLPFSAQSKPPGTLKKRAVVRLFADNSRNDVAEQPPRLAESSRRPRPGTPMARPVVVNNTGVPRTNPRPPTPTRVSLFPPEGHGRAHGSGDYRWEETSSENSFSDRETCTVSSQGGLYYSPPLLPPASCRPRSCAEILSSMREADPLPTLSARPAAVDACSGWQGAAEDPTFRASTTSLCFRSLSSAISCRQQQHVLNLSRSVSRPLFSSRPPQPPCAKPGAEVKKGRKAVGWQEDAHVLRLLDNHYMQWRFVNARAPRAVEPRRVAAEKSLYGLSVRIAKLQSSVTEKRIRLEQIKRRESLLSIIHHQMLHLDEWTILEDEHSRSVLGATKALQDASLRLPVTGNARVDMRELKEVLDSALLMVDSLTPCVARFLPKAEDIDDAASDLASVISTQRALIEECRNLLSQAHDLQVKECCLRTQLIQAKQSNT
ncbi:unnamed protein product [Musa acuminata subsp. burmannicoides]